MTLKEDEGESSQNENGSEDDSSYYESSVDNEGINDDDLQNNSNQGNDDRNSEDERTSNHDLPNNTTHDDKTQQQKKSGDDDKEYALVKLKSFISELNDQGVSHCGITGAQIRDVLGLKKIPSLQSRNVQKFFCYFQSENMNHIKDLYKKSKSVVPGDA